MTENYVRNATVIKVTDGDTIVCLIDMGFRFYVKEALRFNRINAPEMSTKAGKAAKAFLQAQIKPGNQVVVKTFKNTDDMYARWLADVYVADTCLNDLMVNSNHAVYKQY